MASFLQTSILAAAQNESLFIPVREDEQSFDFDSFMNGMPILFEQLLFELLEMRFRRPQNVPPVVLA